MPTDEATSETQPPRFLFQREACSRAWRLVGGTALLAAVGTAATAAALLASQRGAARSRLALSAEAAPVVQLTSGQKPLYNISKFWTVSQRTGCSNWADSITANMSFANAYICGQVCQDKPGCVGFNYQPTDCTSPQGSASKSTCYLFAEKCEAMENACWDYYELKAPKPRPWSLAKARLGCGNWRSLQLGEKTVEMNANACGLRCASAEGCEFYNFKAGECSGNVSLGAHDKNGTCLLFKGNVSTCSEVENHCYDLYKIS